MKKSFVFVCVMSCIMFAECKKGTNVHDGILTINDANNCQEVAFEDVATDIRIVPLISDEPIDELLSPTCYGSTTVAVSSDLLSLYFFEDGKLTGKLNKVGRGPGEYLFIGKFAYSPSTKTVYVYSGQDKAILKYSVPDMTFKGSFEISNVISLAEHDDTTLIARMRYQDKNGIYFIDARDGQVRGMLKETNGYSATIASVGSLGYYTPEYRIVTEMGSVNTVSEVPVGIGQDEKILLRFGFGNDGLPAKYDNLELSDEGLDLLMEFATYAADHVNTLISEIRNVRVHEDAISFWFFQASPTDMRYIRVEDDNIVKYKGFKAKGIQRPLHPNSVTDNGYVTGVSGLPETVFDESGERSEFSANLEKVMKAQAFNNPVLIYYNIK